MNKCFKIRTKLRVGFYMLLKKTTHRKMIIDVTGTLLTPGNYGKDCLGNGEHFNRFGKLISCCCDECDYMLCCLESHNVTKCHNCDDRDCPGADKNYDL